MSEPSAAPMQPSSESAPLRCSACGKPVSPDDMRCPACGVPRGQALRCPHCRAIADLEQSDVLRFACAICGGARVPVDDPAIVRSHAEMDLLKRAGRARTAGGVWRVAAAVVGGFGVVAGLVLALVVAIAEPGATATTALAVMAAIPFVFAVVGWQRGRAGTREATATVDRAWQMVVGELASAHGGEIDAPLVAKAMRIGQAEADRLLAAMSAKSLLSGSITPEGALRYRLLSAPRNPPQLP
jgi:Zn finger protein HypA/HybF involved in hydrogenase expression